MQQPSCPRDTEGERRKARPWPWKLERSPPTTSGCPSQSLGSLSWPRLLYDLCYGFSSWKVHLAEAAPDSGKRPCWVKKLSSRQSSYAASHTHAFKAETKKKRKCSDDAIVTIKRNESLVIRPMLGNSFEMQELRPRCLYSHDDNVLWASSRISDSRF